MTRCAQQRMGRGWRAALAGVCLAGAGLAALPPARAATPDLGPMLYTAGTTVNRGESDWSWLIWQATDESRLDGRAFAVYAKPGPVDAATPFARLGVARRVTDPLDLEPLLQTALALGDDLASLEAALDTLFREAVPTNTFSLSEKLSAVIRGAADDPEDLENLAFLGRRYPAMALAIGRGFAHETAPGSTWTYEVREYDFRRDAVGAVLGRVTLTGGAPLVLPAPDSLIELPDAGAEGHLNVRLRWGTPDALRRVSLLSFGFNVYRMTRAFAVGHGFDLVPPPPDLLPTLLAETNAVVRVNDLPVLIDEDESAPDDHFFVDDDTRGGMPLSAGGFTNGARFVYFIAARDLLGRDGFLTPGLAVTVCDRFPPPPPRRLSARAVTEYDPVARTNRQFVELRWHAPTNLTDGEAVTGYALYRSTNYSHLVRWAGDAVSNRLGGLIAPTSSTWMVYRDLAAAAMPPGRTLWYHVRALDAGVCGGNWSPPTPPAFASLRDWRGPPAPSNFVFTIPCETPEVEYVQGSADRVDKGSETNRWAELNVRLYDPGYDWIEFWVFDGHYAGGDIERDARLVARRYVRWGFTGDVRVIYAHNRSAEMPITYFCRGATRRGRVSAFATCLTYGTNPGNYRSPAFTARIEWPRVPPNDDCFEYHPGSPDDPGSSGGGPEAIGNPSAGAAEWRAYRTVDGGPYSLIGQGALSNVVTLLVADIQRGVTGGGRLCYYLQFLDENGNPSAMSLLGCIESSSAEALPVPMLLPPAAAGEADNKPMLDLTWFCAPAGVERFEIVVAPDPTNEVPALWSSADGLQSNTAPLGTLMTFVEADETNDWPVAIFPTGRLGTGFPSNDAPMFAVSVPVELGVTYRVMIRVVGRAGKRGAFSNVESFLWAEPPPPETIDVPWPPRPLPPVQTATFHPGLRADFLLDEAHYEIDRDRVGIRIGEVERLELPNPSPKTPWRLPTTNDPMNYLYRNRDTAGADTIFPAVLYRTQVPNALFPRVSGDVVQVSPLMERIAFGIDKPQNEVIVYDPYIVALERNPNSSWYDLYWLDTQPLIHGARYRYLIVRFGANGEIERIVPTNEVEVP